MGSRLPILFAALCACLLAGVTVWSLRLRSDPGSLPRDAAGTSRSDVPPSGIGTPTPDVPGERPKEAAKEGSRSESLRHDWSKPIQELRGRYAALKRPADRLHFLLDLINQPAVDPEARRKRAYAIRLLGVVAAEDEQIARQAWPIILTLARNDPDPQARIMAIGAVMGYRVPRQTFDEPGIVLYFEPDKRAGNLGFDSTFPAWARTSAEFSEVLQLLSRSGGDPQTRLAAIRAETLLGSAEFLPDLGGMLRNTGESLEYRQMASKFLYRSSSPEVLPYIQEMALGRLPGMPRGYEIEALRYLITKDLVTPAYESRVASLAADASAPMEDRKLALGLAADLTKSSSPSVGTSTLLGSLEDADPEIRLQSLDLIRQKGGAEFKTALEAVRVRDTTPLTQDYVNAALNRIDPLPTPRPSVLWRLDELRSLLDSSRGDKVKHSLYLDEYERVFDQWKELTGTTE